MDRGVDVCLNINPQLVKTQLETQLKTKFVPHALFAQEYCDIHSSEVYLVVLVSTKHLSHALCAQEYWDIYASSLFSLIICQLKLNNSHTRSAHTRYVGIQRFS